MHPVSLISKAIPDALKPALPCTPEPGVCCVTGQHTLTIPRGALIGSSFCDHAALAAPQSKRIGIDVWVAWHYGIRAEGKARDMRPESNQCWWCDGREFRIVKRADIRQVVLNGSPSNPWAMWVTTSYKKHGSLRARVNNAGYGQIAFEEMLVDASKNWIVAEWWDIMTTAQRQGIGRTIQETLEPPAALIKSIGVNQWLRFGGWAAERQQAPLYKLLCYLLPSREELQSES